MVSISSLRDGSINLKTNSITGIDVKPSTIHLNASGVQQKDPNLSYSYQILDNTYATFSDELSKLPGRSVSKSGIGQSTGVTIVPTGTQLPTGTTATTKLIITGDQTGARFVIPVTITQITV